MVQRQLFHFMPNVCPVSLCKYLPVMLTCIQYSWLVSVYLLSQPCESDNIYTIYHLHKRPLRVQMDWWISLRSGGWIGHLKVGE